MITIFKNLKNLITCKHPAFTLAEVLITLGIIGVVAAITMPTLVANHREKATVAKLKKSYSILNQAYLRAINEHGEIKDWGFGGDSTPSVENPETGERVYSDETITNSKLFLDIISEHMAGVKKCYQPACDISYYNPKTLTGAERTKGAAFNVVDLPDGSSIFGGYISLSTCKTTRCADFAVDINGTKNPPNIIGVDVFYFQVMPATISPFGTATASTFQFPSYCNKNATSASVQNGYACTAWVIQNENMDYLHCDDLSWGGKHKCK